MTKEAINEKPVVLGQRLLLHYYKFREPYSKKEGRLTTLRVSNEAENGEPQPQSKRGNYCLLNLLKEVEAKALRVFIYQPYFCAQVIDNAAPEPLQKR